MNLDVRHQMLRTESRLPFEQNFMFDVPDASVPAVEICWLMSEAGMSTSASDTE